MQTLDIDLRSIQQYSPLCHVGQYDQLKGEKNNIYLYAFHLISVYSVREISNAIYENANENTQI